MVMLTGRNRWSRVFAALWTIVIGPAAAGPGDLDPTFGNAGRVSIDPGNGLEYHYSASVIQQDDHRIVVAGASYSGASSLGESGALVVARFNVDGTLDSTFANGGVATGTQAGDVGQTVIQQPDGKLVVAGSSGFDVALWRFDALGAADATFGTGGIVKLDLGGDDGAVGFVRQPDGKLVAAGTTTFGGDGELALVRFNEDGSLDAAFGSGGVLSVDLLQEDPWMQTGALVVQPDGKLVVIGYHYPEDSPARLFMVRATTDGALDPTFDGDGVMERSFGGSDESTWGLAAGLQPDGKLVIAGGVGIEFWGLVDAVGFIARLEDDGSLDPAFGTGGIVLRDFGGDGYFRSVLTQPDGRISATGTVYIVEEDEYVGADMVVSRFEADGSVDGSFGVAGTSIADFGAEDSGPYGIAGAMTTQADGKILVAGSNRGVGAPPLAVARFGVAGTGFAGLIGFTRAEAVGAENGRAIVLNVRRTGGSTGAVSVEFSTSDLTAEAGTDYAATSGRLDWADGDSSVRTIPIKLLEDSADDDLKRFRLQLHDAAGGAVLATSVIDVSVIDNDSASPPPPDGSSAPVGGGGGGGGEWLIAMMLGSLGAGARWAAASRPPRPGSPRRALGSLLIAGIAMLACIATSRVVLADHRALQPVPLDCNPAELDPPFNLLCTINRRIEGRRLFTKETFGGNGRTCETCHSRKTGTFSPNDALKRLTADPNDPLFLHDGLDDGFSGVSRILEHATVRITLPLPDGLSLKHDPQATHVTFNRGTPTVKNTPALEDIFMYDLRNVTLQEQALGAIRSHAQNTIEATPLELDLIAEFQQTAPRFFSNDRLFRFASGGPPPELPKGRTAAEERGRLFFVDAPFNPPDKAGVCALCHSGPMLNEANPFSTAVFGNPPGVRAFSVFVSERNVLGNPLYTFLVEDTLGPPVEVTTPDIGILMTDHDQLVALGVVPPDVVLGQFGLRRAFFANVFKTPTLWGVKHTAPYFHDNSAKNLEEMLEQYDFAFSNPPISGSIELTPQDKEDIIAFLELL